MHEALRLEILRKQNYHFCGAYTPVVVENKIHVILYGDKCSEEKLVNEREC